MVAISLVKSIDPIDSYLYWKVIAPNNEVAYVRHIPDNFYENFDPAVIKIFSHKSSTNDESRIAALLGKIYDIRARKAQEYYQAKALAEADEVRQKAIRDSLAEVVEMIVDSIELDQLNRRSDSLKKILHTAYGNKAIHVSEWSWDYESEYSHAPDVYFKFLNATKKRIKYVWITLSAYDAVGGRLTSFGQSTVTLKAIGPIEVMGFAEYSFERVFYSKVIDKMKIATIKVQYFDGTYKTVTP
ncbi:MAG: hypothetical protein H3C54_10110 [Taibaiella sp.]|nr:hypothetical protein [Taibaiella sp.]